MEASIPRRSRPATSAESSTPASGGDGSKKSSAEPSLISSMAPPPTATATTDAPAPAQTHGKKQHPHPQQSHNNPNRHISSSGPRPTSASHHHASPAKNNIMNVGGTTPGSASSKPPTSLAAAIATSTASAAVADASHPFTSLAKQSNPCLNPLENRAMKHLDELIDKVSSSLEYNTKMATNSIDPMASREYKTKKGPSIDMFGSFVTTSENKYDFFETDPVTEHAIITPLPNIRIPVFPEDFPPNGQKEWPLKWWGIIEPTEELLDKHDDKVVELGYAVSSKRRKVNSTTASSTNTNTANQTGHAFPHGSINSRSERGLARRDIMAGSGGGGMRPMHGARHRHDFRDGRDGSGDNRGGFAGGPRNINNNLHINNNYHRADERFYGNRPGNNERPSNGNWQSGRRSM